MSDDSDMQPESEEDATQTDPYPLEGKYKDEEDREQSVSLLALILSTEVFCPEVDGDERD
jgi:hypothetical protein